MLVESSALSARCTNASRRETQLPSDAILCKLGKPEQYLAGHPIRITPTTIAFRPIMSQPCAVTIRPARLHEAREMAEMSRELIETGLGWRYTPTRMAALIKETETSVVVASDGTHIQGFAVMQFGDLHSHLTLLCVRPTQRRQGIGWRLHEWLVESARVAGIESVGLEVRTDNAAALAFYGRVGYAESQSVPGYYGGRIAARRMTLLLRKAVP